jgi:hypothetical protein
MTIGFVVFVCTFAASIGGMMLRAVVSPAYLNEESKDTIKVGTGLIATMSALILGLVTASAKTSFDAVDIGIKHAAGDVLSLDRILAQYGPETEPVRQTLKRLMERRIHALWPSPGQRTQSDPTEAMKEPEALAAQVRALTPQNDEQKWLQTRAAALSQSLLETRWEIFTSIGQSIPTAFLGVLTFWLSITFASFGLFAPKNATAVTVLLICALSVAFAVVLVLELQTPFRGMIRVSPAPLKSALSHMNQ